ncbi:MAG: hypothetical protein GC136_00350 [Alphaproteobacteria bacterium]|nr:hypothetical protein [Alphaproteobacteria bacterium]
MTGYDKEIYTLIASALAIYAFIPYIKSVLAGTAKPHIFTWVIWALITFIAFAGQWTAGGGMGSAVSFIVAALSLVVVFLSLKSGEKNITKGDWVMFILSLISIPLWLITKDPFWSVAIVTLIDLAAYWPTIRKSWQKPHEEPALMYGLGFVRHILTIFAMESMNPTTIIFPAILVLGNAVTFLLLIYRRKVLA